MLYNTALQLGEIEFSRQDVIDAMALLEEHWNSNSDYYYRKGKFNEMNQTLLMLAALDHLKTQIVNISRQR